ncbi:hypothetical protein [Methylobacterium sp. Leaf88]|uniref:hypothetical protein n=1 Tax=Methylobacterium sp. Leaf88 TaxID=1736244 RepID=UPI0006FAFACE|nr:hypothetical protein [Methylobacterium sp. Leaf88]KQO70629.1 hypothetical protein ASF20_19215 [Methylobacterium sp. Leaf88]
MAEPLIADRVSVGRRYVRAVDLKRDYADPAALDGYVLTPSARDALERTLRGLEATSTQRAFRVTGPYGSGKSSFAVLLARLLLEEGSGPATDLAAAAGLKEVPSYSPLVLVGRRASMSDEIVGALLSLAMTGPLSDPDTAEQLNRLRTDRAQGIRDIRPVLDALERVAALNRSRTGRGIVLLVDEMGRFIEFAAANPAREDPSLFQQLAERCGGHGDLLGIVAFLHNRFADYVAGLGGWFEGEWARSAERYEELAFHEPAEQALFLLAEAIRPAQPHAKAVASTMRDLFAASLTRGLFSTSAPKLTQVAPCLYPLHPAVTACLAASSRRFGQNERSLFSFLQSHEPSGLQRHMAATPYSPDGLYRTDQLYDYLAGQGDLRFRSPDRERRWHLAMDALVLATDMPQETQSVLKTLALVSVLEPIPGLAPDPSSIAWCLDQPKDRVVAALEELSARGLAHRRIGRSEYSLWSSSSVDLEDWLNRARQAIPQPTAINPTQLGQIGGRRIVAHRHYHLTGNQRTFCVLLGTDAPLLSDCDGAIRIVPVNPGEDLEAVAESVRSASTEAGPLQLYNLRRVHPAHLGHSHELVLWSWVRANCPELRVDDLARGEVERRLAQAQAALDALVAPLSRGEQDADGLWFRDGASITVGSRRELSALLSDVCDDVFRRAPILRNELINRPVLSKAIAAARTKLLELMISQADRLYLGMDGAPPERTIYLSLFKDSGLHREVDGQLGFHPPSSVDPRGWRPVWDRITELVEQRHTVRIDELMGELSAAPYGLRPGPALPILAAYMLINRRRIALMERGSFQPELTSSHFMRLAKSPANFALRQVGIADHREEVLRSLAARIGIWPDGEPLAADLTAIVRALYNWFNTLPDYTMRTGGLSAATRDVRAMLRKAKDPVALVFQDLPRLLGCLHEDGAIDAARLAESLDIALLEMDEAEPRLRAQVRGATLDAFGLRSIEDLRRQVQADFAPHLLMLREYRLRAFVERVLNRDADEDQLLDSVASLLAGKRLTSWDDQSLDRYTFEVRELAQRLARWLALARVAQAGRTPVAGVHLTSADGSERSFFVQERARAPGRRAVATEVRRLLQGRTDASMILAELLAEVAVTHEEERTNG